MRRLPLVASLAALALAGCNAGDESALGNGGDAVMNEETRAAHEQRAPDPELVMHDRWSELFGDPARVVSAANEFGYGASPYAATGATPAYRAAGEQAIGEANAPVRIASSFTAAGASANRIDTVTFTFDVHVAGNPQSRDVREALNTPRRIVNGFFGRFGVGPGDAVTGALTRLESGNATRYGVRTTVVTTPLSDTAGPMDRRVVVTVTNQQAPAA